MHVIAGLRVAL